MYTPFEKNRLSSSRTIFLIFASATGGFAYIPKDRQHFENRPLPLSSSLKKRLYPNGYNGRLSQ
ncbi:hypothetical protein, partial [Porphyromonas gingivalis]|uniref:hypothetical protein n=1 Tax=Porphyromonas gingivalis TaxID=837 RepID=UPI001C4E0748